MGLNWSVATGLMLAVLGPTSCGGTAVSGGSSGAGGRAGIATDSSERPATDAGVGNTPQTGQAGAATNSSGSGSAGATVAGAGGPSSNAGSAGSDLGVLILPADGWVHIESNPLMIQGALLAYADEGSHPNMTADFTGTNACIKGAAMKIDVAPPCFDCNVHDWFWGAAMGLNLNQPLDPTTMMGGTPRGLRRQRAARLCLRAER